MSDLVFLEDDQALTTSLKVAKYFEKRHPIPCTCSIATGLCSW